jgi:hypothetical protein
MNDSRRPSRDPDLKFTQCLRPDRSTATRTSSSAMEVLH